MCRDVLPLRTTLSHGRCHPRMEMPSSSFYHRRALAKRSDRFLGRRGSKTAWADAALVGRIRAVLEAYSHSLGRRPSLAGSAAAGIRDGHDHSNRYKSNNYHAEIAKHF